ncbi:MAG TPA: succinate dehydrogenase [Actinomycetota bacterium]|nr:succinate dehydrogenase [Actinomycetota bacterium]
MATVQDVYERHFPSGISPSSWEVWSWFFMRISGVLLVFLVLGHLAIMHVFGGGIQRVDFDFVAARWHGIFWRSYDWLLLALALLHGANGARTVIHDYVHRDGWRVLLKAVLYTATFVFLSVGTLTIVTFNAATMAGK